MLSGNERSCLDRRSTWKRTHEITVTSRSRHSAVGLLISQQTCPLRGGSWGPWGRRWWQEDHGQHGFWCQWVERESEGFLPGLRVWGLNLYPVTVADVALSLCRPLAGRATLQHCRLPWMGTLTFHTAHPLKRVGGGKVKGERRVRRKGQERFVGRRWRAGKGVIWTQTSRRSDQATRVQCARYGSIPPGQERLLWLMISPARGRDAKELSP